METAIYYFSGTGNSLAAAKSLSSELAGSKIFSMKRIFSAIKDTDKKLNITSNTAVLVFPVYAGGLPKMVARFASRLKIAPEKKLYAIATHGGMPCSALETLNKTLGKNSSRLTGGFLVQMPGNCITLYPAYPKEKQEKLLRISRIRIKEIAQIIAEGKPHRIETSGSIFGKIFTWLFHSGSIKHFRTMDRQFYSTEKCDACGVCEKVCPVSNIRLNRGRPEWLHNCEQCMACIQWCPKEAIEHGKKTIGRKRYRNPSIKPEELMG